MPNATLNRFRTAVLAGLVTTLTNVGCGTHDTRAGDCTGTSSQALVGGSPDASSVGLDNVSTAVAAIVVESDGAPTSLCSGVLVAQRFVLTAAHCGLGAPPEAVRVTFGPNAAPLIVDQCDPPAPTYPAVALKRDPNADVMLVELASNVSSVPVVPIAPTPPPKDQLGVIVGYGLNEQGTLGEKLFAQTTVSAVGEHVAGYSEPDATAASVCVDAGESGPCPAVPLLITADSGSDAGACVGDSGGPLFIRDGSGWQVVGVLSEGSAYCTGQDVYVDLASVAGWISAHISS
jgi:hypothetical protein